MPAKDKDLLFIHDLDKTSIPQAFDYNLIDNIDDQSKIKFFRFTTEANTNIMLLLNKYNNYIYGLLLSEHKYCFDTYKAVDIFMTNVVMLTEKLIHINKTLYVISYRNEDISDDYKKNFRLLLENMFSKTFKNIEEKFNIFIHNKELKSKLFEVIQYLCKTDVAQWIEAVNIPETNGEFIEFIDDVFTFIIELSDKFYVMSASLDRNLNGNGGKCIIFKTDSMTEQDIKFIKDLIWNGSTPNKCKIRQVN